MYFSHSAPSLVVFWNCKSAFFSFFSTIDLEWGYFLAICQIELSNSVTLHIVKLQDFWSFDRVCLISHSGLLKKNKPNSTPNGILPTIHEIYTVATWHNLIVPQDMCFSSATISLQRHDNFLPFLLNILRHSCFLRA